MEKKIYKKPEAISISVNMEGPLCKLSWDVEEANDGGYVKTPDIAGEAIWSEAPKEGQEGYIWGDLD